MGAVGREGLAQLLHPWADTDADGDVYVAGVISRDETFGFGNGVTAPGPYWGNKAISAVGQNPLLVMYGADGTPRWAQSVALSASNTAFEKVAIDAAGHMYAVGFFEGGTVQLSRGVSVPSTGARVNRLLVRY